MATATKLKCQFPGCEFETSTPQGMGAHRRKHENESRQQNEDSTPEGTLLNGDGKETTTAIEQVPVKRPYNKRQAQDPPISFPEIPLALACRGVEELLKSMAIEHDLPPRSFAREVVRIVYGQTLR